ncbi:MAG TPA: peptidyl-prolyl cis-trans isomerase [Thermoanaerobaculia bacterium]|nr:peptidyl-prolyl cis-trans isomerase [Thermoanaerobaculia bacterium]
MLARRAAILLFLLAFATLPACKRKPAIPPDVIVRVNERMLTLADFKRYLDRNAGTDLAQLTPEVASAMLDQFIEEIIVSEHAAVRGIEVPAEKIAAAVRTEAGATVIEKRDEMRRERLLAQLAAEIPEPGSAEMQAYYDRHLDEFRSGEEVSVRQILVHDQALANEIHKKLKAGAPFADLSSEHSRAPNAKRGGEIGFVSRGELPKMFDEEIFSLDPGEVSDVIQTDSSFHIFRVDERRAPGTLDAESAAPLIRVRIREEALRERMNQLVARSKQEMKIDVLTRRLPFRYSGQFKKTENE